MGVDMKIEKIIKLKNNKYKILINKESFITYDNVILDNDLLYKKEIDKNLYNKIVNDTKYYEIYNKTVSYIMKNRRSEKQIKEYLNKYELSEDKIKSIINKLKSINLINDLEYCKAFINDKVYISKNGINKIRIDLLNQDIPIDVIEEELKNIDLNIINNRLEKLIQKKIFSNKKYSNYHLKQKIINEMVTLGYEKNKVIEIIDDNLRDDDLVIRKEFNKLYTKLSSKFSGEELGQKIKQKLFSKGFSLEKIDNLIKEKTEN